MASTIVCQATLPLKTNKRTAPQGVPLQQQLGYSRPQTATFATSGALAYGSHVLSTAARHLPQKAELTEAAEDLLAAFVGKRDSKASRPTFRSALEQVSYDTNSSLAESRPSRNNGIAGRFTRIFGK